jgi:hypothetical protein
MGRASSPPRHLAPVSTRADAPVLRPTGVRAQAPIEESVRPVLLDGQADVLRE